MTERMELAYEALTAVWSSFSDEPVIAFEKARLGVANHNWILTTAQGRFVLRCVYEGKSVRDLDAEFTFIAALERERFPYAIPVPLFAKDGSHIIEHEGRIFWGYPYLEGHTITGPVTRSQAEQIGVMIARMHTITERIDLKGTLNNAPFSITPIIDDAKAMSTRTADATSTAYYREALPIFLGFVERTPYPTELEAFPIHRDINPENVLFTRDTLTAVIDFDNASACDEPFVKDLANALLYSCTRDDRCAFDFERCSDMIRSYASIRSLTKKQIEAVPHLIVLGCFEDFSYEYWLAVNEPERTNPKKLAKRFEMGQWVFEHHDDLIAILESAIGQA